MSTSLSLITLSQPTYIYGCSKREDFYLDLVKNRYLDLNLEDQKLVRELYIAEEKGNYRKWIKIKKQLMKRMGELLNILRNSSLNLDQKINILTRMINLHALLRDNNISQVKEIKEVIEYKDSPNFQKLSPYTLEKIWAEPIEITLQDLEGLDQAGDKIAQQIITYLSLEKEDGYTYFQYLKDNVHNIVFLPRIRDFFKILASDEYWGTAEELSKYVFADTYSEINKMPRPVWKIVANIIKEAAHIEYFHQSAHADESITITPYESYAYKVQVQFLENLLKIAKDPTSTIKLGPEQLSWIRRAKEYVEDRIKRKDF